MLFKFNFQNLNDESPLKLIDDSCDNYLESLLDSVTACLARNSRSFNANIGFTPMSSITIPFSRVAFWKLFKDVIPKNISQTSKICEIANISQ